jgi:hypothetical protein
MFKGKMCKNSLHFKALHPWTNSKTENNLSVSLQTLGQSVKELWDHIQGTHIYHRNMVFI